MPSSPPKRPRLLARPAVLSALFLIATLALAGALGLEATRAATSHRATAEEILRGYAAVAAWEYTRGARIWLGFGMSQAGNAISAEIPAPGARAPLPGPGLLRRVLAEKECDCMSAGFARTVFRVTHRPMPAIAVEGEPLSEGSRLGLIALVAADTTPISGPRQWRMLPPGEPALSHRDDMVLLWEFPDGDGGGTGSARRVAYGMAVEVAQIQRPLSGAMDEAELLPPTLTGTVPKDSLVRITIAGANGAPIQSFGLETTARYAAADTLGAMYGGLGVTAAVRPEAAPLLIVGGLPPSRLPQIIALLGLTLLLGAGALLLLRREHQLARLRDDFVSGVSHELRTPLTQIRVLSELFATDGFRTDAERERAIGVIHREALRLSNLVDNVLQFTRLRRRPEVPPPTPVPLGEVITETADAFGPLLSARANRLAIEARDGPAVPGDREALARILRNLIENAVKYGPIGQTIRVTAERSGSTVRLAVEDQGPGVPPKERGRVWRPYHRLERDRNAPVGGSGLGLSVVAELAGLMGGRVSIEDAPGGGARFVVELPAVPGEAAR